MNFLSRWFRRLPKAPSWIAPEAFARRLGRESALLIIDVRSPDEFTGPLGHITSTSDKRVRYVRNYGPFFKSSGEFISSSTGIAQRNRLLRLTPDERAIHIK